VKEPFIKLEQRGSVNLSAIIFDARNVPSIDSSAIHTLIEMVEEWKRRNIVVCFVKVRGSVKKTMIQSGLLDVIGTGMIFAKRHEALEFAVQQQSKRLSYSTY
jgi:anti-anti-sigma factor